jgi:molybdate transport system substrate-binding protein
MQNLHDFMPARVSRRSGLALLVAATRAPAWAQAPVHVLAASDLKFALAQVAALYQQSSGQLVNVTYGSSGNLVRQIEQGLRADIFMSADEALALRLADAGLTQGRGQVYGQGRLALLVSSNSGLRLDANLQGLGEALARQPALKIAIANPEHAPYGRAAREALQKAGLWERAQKHLVLGDNAAQAAQFVASGAAPVGLAPHSLALAPELAARTRFALVDAALHAPLRQRMVLLQSASAPAHAFYRFVQTEASRSVLARYGLGG